MTRRPRYTRPRSSSRARGVKVQIALTAAVVVFAVALVTTIMVGRDDDNPADTQPIRLGAAGTGEPARTVVAVYSDHLEPHCADFERGFGPAPAELVDEGTITVDYTVRVHSSCSTAIPPS